jgi:hypothetical protein
LEIKWLCNHYINLLYASSWVIGTNWVLYMHPLEFQRLNGYCRCILCNYKNKHFSRFFNKQLLCLTSTLIHIKKSIEQQITTKIGILVSCSIVGTFYFSTIVHILWFYGKPIIQWFTCCFIILFLKSCGTQARLLGVAYSRLLGSINFVERRFPRVTKSPIDKSFNKLVK